MNHIGLGFFLAAHDRAPTWFGHTGSNTGFVCASMASVSGRRGIVVILNGDNGTPAAKLLLQAITRTRQWSDTNLASDPPQPAVRLHLDDATTLSTEDLDLRVLLAPDGSIALQHGGHLTRLQRAT